MQLRQRNVFLTKQCKQHQDKVKTLQDELTAAQVSNTCRPFAYYTLEDI